MNKLPEEMLCRVFQDLSCKDLRKLSLVERRFHRIMAPLLYSNCQLIRQDHEPQIRSIRNFLRTLVISHDLRSLVQHVRVGPWLVYAPDATDAGVAHISMDLLESISASVPAFPDLPSEMQQNFKLKLRESSHDAMIFAILNNAPNLTSLTLDTESIRYHSTNHIMVPCDLELNQTLTMRLFELSISPTLDQFHGFKTLSYLCIANRLSSRDSDPEGWLQGGWDSRLLPTFLQLPALRTFVGGGCRDWKRQGDTWLIEEGSSTVTSITLTDCDLETPTVRQLLRACRSLKSFECTRRCDFHYSNVDYSYEGFYRDLLRHRDSLHTLHLHTKACGCDKSFFTRKPIESFAGLENLKDLLVDEVALFGNIEAEERALTEILPGSLEHLVIMGGGQQDDVFTAIRQALLSDKTFPAVEVREGHPLEALQFARYNIGLRVRRVNNEALNKRRGSFIIDRR